MIRISGTGRRHAFTLVEMLIVITIIGILVGLAVAAAFAAMRAGMKARTVAEIDSLATAVKAYKNDLGQLPPCMANVDIDEQAVRLMSHLRSAFPKFRPTPNGSDPPGAAGYVTTGTYISTNYVMTSGPLDISRIDQAEALVLFLGGMPSPPGFGTTKLLGFHADATNPFRIDPPGTGRQKRNAYFEFVEARLVDLDADGWYEYIPQGTPQTSFMPPYVYFDSITYQSPIGVGTDGWLCYPSPALGTTPQKGPIGMIGEWGTCVPYAYSQGGPANPADQSFQIVSAGMDSAFGLGVPPALAGPSFQQGFYRPDQSTPGALFNPDKFNLDNLANFISSALEESVPQ